MAKGVGLYMWWLVIGPTQNTTAEKRTATNMDTESNFVDICTSLYYCDKSVLTVTEDVVTPTGDRHGGYIKLEVIMHMSKIGV
jgi:hypothetical protein